VFHRTHREQVSLEILQQKQLLRTINSRVLGLPRGAGTPVVERDVDVRKFKKATDLLLSPAPL
ncbi:hypothetical protein P3383_23415, partial [Vibrio parahaemolyticus]|nr:hypothetical protein [Vibrio parahaemolyticus]